MSDVLNTVQRLDARAVESAHNGPDSRWEADYRGAVIRSLDRVELFGADIPPKAFVSLNVDTETALWSRSAEDARIDVGSTTSARTNRLRNVRVTTRNATVALEQLNARETLAVRPQGSRDQAPVSSCHHP
jgi:hypothetical protein